MLLKMSPYVCYTGYITDESNGQKVHFKQLNRDKCQCTKKCRHTHKWEHQIDKNINILGVQIESAMEYNRSHRCLEKFYSLVQNRLNIMPIYSKFAFHSNIHRVIVIVLLFCSVVNGQYRQQTMQKAGE